MIFNWTVDFLNQHQIAYKAFEKIDSTNKEAERVFLKQKKDFYIFLAKNQTEGKGRNKNKWANSDLMISFCFNLSKAPQKEGALFISQLLFTSLKKHFSRLNLKLKKPNDIFIENKKVAGVLLQVFPKTANFTLIVGLGMNVFQMPDCLDAGILNYQNTVTQKKWEAFLKDFIWLLKSESKNF